MTTRILATLALLGFMSSAGAFRVMGQPERPVELALSGLTLPQGTGGSVTVRSCETCRISTHQFAEGARFVVDGRAVKFPDFLKVVNDIKGSPQTQDRTLVGVYVDVTTERVTRITINRPRR
jgi:hypothetical protein